MQLRHLKADDVTIQKEGIDRLTHRELQNANQERGMPAYGLAEEELKTQLGDWIDMSLKYKVPPSLLLLSRTLYTLVRSSCDASLHSTTILLHPNCCSLPVCN